MEYTAQQELMGKVLTSGQQSAQQGQDQTVMEGSVDGQIWLDCCLRTEKRGMRGTEQRDVRTRAQRIATQIIGMSRAEEGVYGLPEAAQAPKKVGRGSG